MVFIDERSTPYDSISFSISRMLATASSIGCARRQTGIDGSARPSDHGHGPIAFGAINQAANSVAVIEGVTVAVGGSGGSRRGMIDGYRVGIDRGSPSSDSAQRHRPP